MTDGSGDFTGELRTALEAVREAGRAVMEHFRSDPEVRHKGPDQPVTEADLSANRILESHLLGAYPDYGWLSEETVDRPERLDRKRVWVVDPIDGTRSFIAGYREFGISVALVEDGRPAVGVVYNPASGDLFRAITGGGAYRRSGWRGEIPAGGDRLETVEPAGDGTPVIMASRSETRRGEMDPFAGEYEIRLMGSTAVKLALVAAGTGHLFLSRGPKSEWDLAGAHLVVEEAGGVVTDLRGTTPVYNGPDPYIHGVVAGPAGAHGALLDRSSPLPAPRLRGGRVYPVGTEPAESSRSGAGDDVGVTSSHPRDRG